MEEKDEEELGPWSLEHGSFGYLVGYVEGDILSYFDDKVLSFQDFKLYFLRLLYSWSVGLSGNTNLNFLAFVNRIMDESLRA